MNKTSREYLEQQFYTSRMSLLIVISFTVANIVMLLGESYTQFLFSATIPYLLTAFGIGMDMEVGGSTYLITALVISGLILAIYLILWLLSKKRPALLYVALGLFALDTAFLLLVTILSGSIMSELVDLAFHGWVLYILFKGARNGIKLKSLPEDGPTTGTDYLGSNPDLDL